MLVLKCGLWIYAKREIFFTKVAYIFLCVEALDGLNDKMGRKYKKH